MAAHDDPDAANPARALEALLARARARLLVYAGLELTLGAGAGLLVGLGLALVLVGLLPFSFEVRAALWALIGLGGVVGGGLVIFRRVLPLFDDLAVAFALEEAAFRRGAALGDAVRSAVELADPQKDAKSGRSRALCDAHINSTLARVEAAKAPSSLGGTALGAAVPTLLAAASAVFLAGGLWLTIPDSVRSRFAALFDDEAAEAALKARARDVLPLVTDLKLVLRFPSYMGREDQVIPGSSGDIVAPPGTEVHLEGRADRTVQEAALLVGDEAVALSVDGGRRLEGRFVVEGAGSYRFRLVEAAGDVTLDPVAHRITLSPDEVPEVELLAPEEDETVQLEDEVDLAFLAKDDYGVTRVRVVVHRQASGAGPYEKDLAVVDMAPRELRSSGSLTIEETGARPGDRLSVYIEAVDNDTVSGPKAGRSKTRVLTVFSAAEHHRKIIELEEKLLDGLVHLLGDELEAPLSADLARAEKEGHSRALAQHEPITKRGDELLRLMEEVLRELKDDELTADDVRRAVANMRAELARPMRDKAELLASSERGIALGRAVPAYVWRHLAGHQRRVVEKLEQHILYLEDLLNTQRLKEAENIVAEMKRTQEALKELIQQYKESPDDDTREAILEEIKRLREQMRELNKRLAELQRDVPDEYLNQEAFETEDMMQDAMDLDRMIEEGKLDEAAEALERMVEQTEDMLKKLEEDQEEYGGEEYKELREKLERFGEELSALEAAQENLLRKTERQLDAARKEAERRLAGKLEKKLKDLLEKAEEANETLGEMDTDGLYVSEQEDAAFAKARAEDLQKALENGDLEDALEAAQEAAQAARAAERALGDRTRGRFGTKNPDTLRARGKLQEARPKLDEVLQELGELLPDPADMLSKPQRQAMRRDAKQQQELEQRAQKLEGMMEEIGKDLPVFGPEHGQRASDAARDMRQAQRMLGGERPREARGAQQQALEQLKQLREALEQQGQGQGKGGGLPMPLPGGGSSGDGEREGSSGRRNPKDKVKIPGADEFKVPDAFRKDILDAMREGAPEEWEGEVKRYYEELVK